MNTTQNVYIHKAALSGTGASSVLKEGASVLVRIVSQTGPDRYTAYFAGARFSVTSAEHLVPGMSFRAAVSIRNGMIALVPQKPESAFHTSDGAVRTFPQELTAEGLIADAGLSAYVSSLGLVPDGVTLDLLNMMKQMDIRFDSSLFNKARLAARKFPGHEREAAEAAFLLESKGLPLDEKTISYFIFPEEDKESGRNEDDETARGRKEFASEKTNGMIDIGEIRTETADFFNGVFSGRIPGAKARQGILTVFNHSGFRSGASWIQIPFELSLNGGKNTGKGILRCFLNENNDRIEKNAVKISFGRKSYFFVLYYNNVRESCKKVRFSTVPPVPAGDMERQKRLLLDTLGKSFRMDEHAEVEWADPDDLSGFCADTLPVSTVEGCV